MASSVPSKVFIQVETPAEQQENLKNSRKVFNALQKVGSTAVGTDKENLLIGRSPAYIAKESLIKKTTSVDNEVILTPDQTMKRKLPAPSTSKSSQTSPQIVKTTRRVTVDDLTSEKPLSDRYWELLAEKRRQALEDTLEENQELYERIANLEDELNQSKNLLEEARDLVTVLTEMLEEKEVCGPNASVETEPTDISDNNLDLTS